MSSHRQLLTMSAITVLLLTWASMGAVTLAWTPQAPLDIRYAAKELVKDIRTLTDNAKQGTKLSLLQKEVTDLQDRVTELVLQLGDVSQSETNYIIKMAAAATGSHEVMTVMLASDPLSVMNGRVALSLAFLDHLAQKLDDELSLKGEVGPHLAAIIFGTKTLSSITDAADKMVTTMASSMTKAVGHNRVKRQSVSLGNGWSLGVGGVTWTSNNGMTTFNVKPTFKNLKLGVKATLIIRF